MAATEKVLEVERLATRYANGALGINDVSLEVRAGQIVVLFGANGAGKTTTVRSIGGFMRSERARIVQGSIRVLGKEVAGREPHQMARLGVGTVPERTKVFANLSVAENMRAVRVADRAVLEERTDWAYRIFPVLAQRRRQAAGSLSGGQQQMLAISRAMLSDPRLLLIDELTLGLHHSFFAPIFDGLREIASGGTGIVVIDESVAASMEVADYCYLIGGGRVRTHGSPEEFAADELVAAGYVEQGDG